MSDTNESTLEMAERRLKGRVVELKKWFAENKAVGPREREQRELQLAELKSALDDIQRQRDGTAEPPPPQPAKTIRKSRNAS